MVSLEDKIDWKQWLPFYGIYEIFKDFYNGKPTILTSDNEKVFVGGVIYHAITTPASVFFLSNGIIYIIK